ncbi:MAG: DUF58 domain-containing protein [Kouleothrix sp.]|jgi:uncharacterized protein (DUF58 family)|nr:DUF58 domain-containing protein [Kouleothrix sp.]
MNDLFWLMLVLFFVAAALRSELFFYLLYLVVGLQLLARFWLGRSARQITWVRRAPAAAFPGERTDVAIELHNNGLLPLPWITLNESIPAALRNQPALREVLSLGAGERRVLTYSLVGQRRGYYRLGPLTITTGDVLGLDERTLSLPEHDGLTIYPSILPLAQLGLPAALPYGTLAASQRLFSDPARPVGVRPYQAADGVRRIDWKTTAHAGTPQVRRYQPAIALETLVALAFTREEYAGRFAFDTMERALVTAASIVAHLVERRQPVGLCTSGYDAATHAATPSLPVGHGRAHLMAIMGALGRLEAAPHGDLLELLSTAAAHLGWGSTVVVITGQRGPELVARLLPLLRRGLSVALIITEPTPADLGLPRQYGITSYGLWRDGRPTAG